MEVQTTLLRMPIELVNALASSDKARHFFDSPTPSHKRAFIEWIGDAIPYTIRKERARQAINMLEASNKTIII